MSDRGEQHRYGPDAEVFGTGDKSTAQMEGHDQLGVQEVRQLQLRSAAPTVSMLV